MSVNKGIVGILFIKLKNQFGEQDNKGRKSILICFTLNGGKNPF